MDRRHSSSICSLALIISLVAMVSCRESWERALENANAVHLYGNSKAGWKLFQKSKMSEDSWEYALSRFDGDTVRNLFLNTDDNGHVMSSEYKAAYPCGMSDTCFLSMNNGDTLYLYSKRGDVKTFVVGEYGYRFTYMQLKRAELDYYLTHEDSLLKVKGNGLRRLPGYERSETVRYWLPERFVLAGVAGDTASIDRLLIPIEGLSTDGTRMQVLTYGGEEGEVQAEPDNGKIRLKNLLDFINQKYLPKDSINSYIKTDFLISLQGERLMLEMKKGGHSRRVAFVDRYKDVVFSDLRETISALRRGDWIRESSAVDASPVPDR